MTIKISSVCEILIINIINMKIITTLMNKPKIFQLDWPT